MIYSDFTTALVAALVIDTGSDADFNNYLPRIIEQAELRCFRDLDLVALRKIATASLAIGASTAATPADWIIGRHVWAAAPAGGPRFTLLRRDEDFLVEDRPDPTVTGIPKYWTEQTTGALLIAPAAGLALTLTYAYSYHPTTLSGSNTSTFLSLTYPDLFFAAAMVAASGYLKNYGAQADDPRMALSWDQTYREILSGATREEARRKGESYFDMTPSAPPASTQGRGFAPAAA